MSVSLISRQLHTLKLVQRTAAPWLASATSASPVAASNFTTASHHKMAPVQSSMNSQWPIKIEIWRTFSTNIQEEAVVNDDGGPVAGSANDFAGMTNSELADMSTIPGWNLVHNPPRRNPRGALVGKVVSDKMQKTVNVAVDRFKMIPKYRKRWRFTRKFMAHDEHEVCNVGDLVMIVPCQKISKHKHFMVREIIRPQGQL
eukprot:706926_1